MADSTGHQFTRGGNLKAPSGALLCKWIKACCGEISSETIKGLFKSCGITIATDAIKDDTTHCFKEGHFQLKNFASFYSNWRIAMRMIHLKMMMKKLSALK